MTCGSELLLLLAAARAKRVDGGRGSLGGAVTTPIEPTATHFETEDAELTRRLGIVDSHNDFATAIGARRACGDYDSLVEYWLPRFRDGGLAVVVTACGFRRCSCRKARSAARYRLSTDC